MVTWKKSVTICNQLQMGKRRQQPGGQRVDSNRQVSRSGLFSPKVFWKYPTIKWWPVADHYPILTGYTGRHSWAEEPALSKNIQQRIVSRHLKSPFRGLHTCSVGKPTCIPFCVGLGTWVSSSLIVVAQPLLLMLFHMVAVGLYYFNNFKCIYIYIYTHIQTVWLYIYIYNGKFVWINHPPQKVRSALQLINLFLRRFPETSQPKSGLDNPAKTMKANTWCNSTSQKNWSISR